MGTATLLKGLGMKHVHIVYCHPSEDSLTAAVRDAFIKGLDVSGKNVMRDDRIHDRALQKRLVLLGGTERSDAPHRKAMRKQNLETAYRLGCEL
jgi:hypothetical protein